MTSLLSPGFDVPPTSDAPLPDGHQLLARHDAILAALSTAGSEEERAQLKRDIVALFRDADAALSHFTAFKESVKSLAAQWKHGVGSEAATRPRAAEAATQPASAASGSMSGSARVDHLGASTFIEKGWSKLSLGDAPGAEVALRRALELTPGDNDAETLLGWAHMMQEHYDSALLTFHNVLLRDPQHALARTNVGFICLRKRNYGEAIEHLSRAIRLDTDRKATLYAHLYLGMVYREREMYDDADGFFGRALELGPNLLQAWYERGRGHWFAGRPDDARTAWRAGANANKFNPWGKRCAEMLAYVEQGGAPPQFD